MSDSALSQPGPHGYPTRFAVRRAGHHGLKFCGADAKQPVRFIEKHDTGSLRQVLHKSGHKKDDSPRLVSVYKHRSFAQQHLAITIGPVTLRPRQPQNFMVILHRNNGNDQVLELNRVKATTWNQPETYRFQLATPANHAGEAFEWRDARFTRPFETRGTRKASLPVIKTGDQRPPEKKMGIITRGYVLVRLGGQRGAAGKGRPLGFTEQGEEIVASYAQRNTTWIGQPKFFFQFWGSGAQGKLGEDFSHVAAATGSALWQDEMIQEKEKQRRQARNRN
jgi:hypothetical protein